jgi:hypothetical protein
MRTVVLVLTVLVACASPAHAQRADRIAHQPTGAAHIPARGPYLQEENTAVLTIRGVSGHASMIVADGSGTIPAASTLTTALIIRGNRDVSPVALGRVTSSGWLVEIAIASGLTAFTSR